MKLFKDMDKNELIEVAERLETTVKDLRKDNEFMFRKDKWQMSEIVRLRRQVEALQEKVEGHHAKNAKAEKVRV